MIGVTTVAISTIPEIGINIGGGEAMEGTIFITATEMAEILGISKPYAYKIIKQMNEDLEANGFITSRLCTSPAGYVETDGSMC